VIVIHFLIGTAIPILPFLAGAALIEIVIQSRHKQPRHRSRETCRCGQGNNIPTPYRHPETLSPWPPAAVNFLQSATMH
jgi:hypothetical protein